MKHSLLVVTRTVSFLRLLMIRYFGDVIDVRQLWQRVLIACLRCIRSWGVTRSNGAHSH